MKKKTTLFLILLVLGVGIYSFFHMNRPVSMTKENAVLRAEKFIKAVNDNKPAYVYDYLAPDIKKLIDEEGFVKNFKKERSYPYLTPLYLYLDQLELGKDQKVGHVECIVAARLPGEKMEFSIRYVDDNYYIDGFRDIADGSFIKKFDKLSAEN